MGSFASQEEEKKLIEKPVMPVSETVQETVQRDLSDVNGPEGGMLPDSVSSRIQQKRGSGQRLSDRQLQRFSRQFGRDMSDVRVHTDGESDTISRSLNARAFTIGSDVFLTKGINPEGGGRDAQTMTHELTHVVQQNGQASSGPLKLGAADTAQEHEAESTAQREFDPELTEEDGTIQRGFLSDIGTSIAHSFLDNIGLGEAFDEFMSGDSKVKDAIEKLSDEDKEAFAALEEDIKTYGDQLKEAKAEESADYDDIYKDYDDAQEQELDLLQKADPSITEADLDRFHSSAGRSFFSSVFSTIAGNFRAGFENDPKKKEAVRKSTVASVNTHFAANNRFSDERKPEIKARQNVVKAIWRSVQGNKELREKYKGWVEFRSNMETNFSKLIDEALNKGKTTEDTRNGILKLLQKKDEKPEKDAGAPKESASGSVQAEGPAEANLPSEQEVTLGSVVNEVWEKIQEDGKLKDQFKDREALNAVIERDYGSKIMEDHQDGRSNKEIALTVFRSIQQTAAGEDPDDGASSTTSANKE